MLIKALNQDKFGFLARLLVIAAVLAITFAVSPASGEGSSPVVPVIDCPTDSLCPEPMTEETGSGSEIDWLDIVTTTLDLLF